MRTSRLAVLVFAALILGSGGLPRTCLAAGGILSGIVKDNSGNPLGGVLVTLMEGRFQSRIHRMAVTNNSGRFEILNLVPGLYSLQVNGADYPPLIKSGIRILSGRVADLTLVLQSLAGISSPAAAGAPPPQGKEDIEAVLRSTASTRPILRWLDVGGGERKVDARLALQKSRQEPEIRGLVSFYTNGYSGDPYLMNAGGMSTEFALVRDINASLNVAVAGVISDTGFAEVNSTLRLNGRGNHQPAFSLSFGQLPFVAFVSSIMGENLERLRRYSFDFQDEVKLSEFLSVAYGMEFQGMNAPAEKAFRLLPRWSLISHPFRNNRTSFLRTNSLPRMNRTLTLPDGGTIAFLSPFHHELGSRPHLGLPNVTHSELNSQQQFGDRTALIVGIYQDQFKGMQGVMVGSVGKSGLQNSRGLRIALQHALAQNVDSAFGYTYGGGLTYNSVFTSFQSCQSHVIAARVSAEVPFSGTRISTIYRWISGNSVTVIDPYQELFESTSPKFSLVITQAIPYVGRFLPGKLEAQLEMRNLMADQQEQIAEAQVLRRMAFVQSPKSIRGGIKLEF